MPLTGHISVGTFGPVVRVRVGGAGCQWVRAPDLWTANVLPVEQYVSVGSAEAEVGSSRVEFSDLTPKDAVMVARALLRMASVTFADPADRVRAAGCVDVLTENFRLP